MSASPVGSSFSVDTAETIVPGPTRSEPFSPASPNHLPLPGTPSPRQSMVLPAEPAPHGKRRCVNKGAEPTRLEAQPQIVGRHVLGESSSSAAQPREATIKPMPRAREVLTDILLDNIENRHFLLPAPEGLSSRWSELVSKIQSLLPRPIEPGAVKWEEEDPRPRVSIRELAPPSIYQSHSTAAGQAGSQPRAIPVASRRLSTSQASSNDDSASHSFEVIEHHFALPPRRSLPGAASSEPASDSDSDSPGNSGFSNPANPPVILGTHPCEWPVRRVEPFLTDRGTVTWPTEKGHPLSMLQGTASTLFTYRNAVWGLEFRLRLWYHMIGLRKQLVAEHGEWFRYTRGFFTASPNQIQYRYGGVWQEGSVLAPPNTPVHHCVQWVEPEPELAPVASTVPPSIVSEESVITASVASGATVAQVLEAIGDPFEVAAEEGHDRTWSTDTAPPTPKAGSSETLLPAEDDASSATSYLPSSEVHHYMWEKDGTYFSCASWKPLNVNGDVYHTEWIDGWTPYSLRYS